MDATLAQSSMNGLSKTATFASQQIERVISQQAAKVERLKIRRRKLRRDLVAVEHDLKTQKRFLKGLIANLNGEVR